MIKLILLALAVAALCGCATEGQPEASGNTASLSKEIPPPKKHAPHFDPPGHSLMKGDTPGAVKEGGAAVKADVSAPAKRSGQ